MSGSLLSGVSGLVAHQRMLDVVGNNLANSNTTGFKAQRVLFADQLWRTIRPASADNNGTGGAINPIQIGSGVRLAQVDRTFSQGNLELTGGLTDFAIEGDGFFVVSDGNRNLYSRNGAFALDENQILVDSDANRVPFSHKRRMGANLRRRSGSKPAVFPPQLLREKDASQ